MVGQSRYKPDPDEQRRYGIYWSEEPLGEEYRLGFTEAIAMLELDEIQHYQQKPHDEAIALLKSIAEREG